MKTLFRKYPSGEIVAVFPDEPGEPDGSQAVAFVLAGGFFACDPVAIIADTEPATPQEAARLRKVLTDEHMIAQFEADVAFDQTADAEARLAKVLDPEDPAHRKFGVLKYRA